MTGLAGGPYFEDLEVGLTDSSAPALTLTEGHAALHQAIVGDRLRLPLDANLARKVAGAALAHPALAWDVSIGQSTPLTQRVIANLFYRGLRFHRAPAIGDTLSTTTAVTALRQNSPRSDRPARGMAALHVTTVDQDERPVLDYWRCAMLPLRDPSSQTGHADDFAHIPAELAQETPDLATQGWDLAPLREGRPGPFAPDLVVGGEWRGLGGNVVSNAPELARLSLNIASAHHDATSTAAGRRLVYGGHTVGIAAAHVCLALPDLATIVAWERCEHLAPVFEGDTLYSDVRIEAITSHRLTLAVGVRAVREDGSRSEVLDWRLHAIHP